jgi:hypothetical protein
MQMSCVIDVVERHRSRHETREVRGVCGTQGGGRSEGVDEEGGAAKHAVAQAVKDLETRR